MEQTNQSEGGNMGLPLGGEPLFRPRAGSVGSPSFALRENEWLPLHRMVAATRATRGSHADTLLVERLRDPEPLSSRAERVVRVTLTLVGAAGAAFFAEATLRASCTPTAGRPGIRRRAMW